MRSTTENWMERCGEDRDRDKYQHIIRIFQYQPLLIYCAASRISEIDEWVALEDDIDVQMMLPLCPELCCHRHNSEFIFFSIFILVVIFMAKWKWAETEAQKVNKDKK